MSCSSSSFDVGSSSSISSSNSAALQEALIEQRTTCSVAQMVQEFELDMIKADQELQQVIASAEEILGAREPVGHEYHDLLLLKSSETITSNEQEGSSTTNDDDNSIQTNTAASTSELLQDVAIVDTPFATKVSKTLGKNCVVEVSTDGEIAAIPVESLVETVKLLLNERNEFIQETLNLMAISRRTVNLALTVTPEDAQ